MKNKRGKEERRTAGERRRRSNPHKDFKPRHKTLDEEGEAPLVGAKPAKTFINFHRPNTKTCSPIYRLRNSRK